VGRGRGHELDVAHDVHGSFERAANLRPSAVIIDLDSTPSGDVELAERLYADPATRAIPLIAIGATTSPLSERMRRRFVRHVIKPIDVEEFGATILETVAR
jgi:CheY-like chemotaxis protein